MSDLTDFYEAFRTEGYCTDCWVQNGHDDKCPHTSQNPQPSLSREVTEGSELSDTSLRQWWAGQHE